ncbi:MAG: DUF4864 domain-containing protein, partial [Granulosicoccus sp.]|nr:DUF4864 domain-containing protein [Granulosicoccus sp.]
MSKINHVPKTVSDLQTKPWRVVGFLLLACIFSNSTSRADEHTTLTPSASFTPQEVVQIVIEALGNNEAWGQDAGIATVYRFASPGNRASTGPLPRFTHMIKRGFSDMLDHEGSTYDPMEIEGDIAVQAVWLMTASGKEVGYAFQLGKQQDGDYRDMW